ncbi:ubiquitin carboxyl-terminal hydrolase 44-like [Saccoglossus kowalevskii]|uniref:Ubiquitin carboxyl-terminal hydrolase n=1 Tax=Saccoglossus kowalevskii TaxID=10224 RepID=A0ABM0GP61_SACKO|nr:PREDICTED: ubiquitin carboxyl-terminal hydrolase 44-like [Saccoglossus kowalevskii]
MDNCKHVSKLRLAQNHSILNPQKWLCLVCGTTESVWACLSCPHVACGRYNEEHALKHFEERHHPVALEVNEKYVFCYICDDYVLNDNSAGDIRLLRTTLTAIAAQNLEEKSTRSGRVRRPVTPYPDTTESPATERQLHMEDRAYTALYHRRHILMKKIFTSWRSLISSRQKKMKEQPPPKQVSICTANNAVAISSKIKNSTSSLNNRKRPISALAELSSSASKRKWTSITPGVTGLRNLGNTCYMNSILQVLGHIEKIRDCFLNLDMPDILLKKGIDNRNGNGKKKIYARQTTVECYKEVETPRNKHRNASSSQRQSASNGGLSGGSSKGVENWKYKDPKTLKRNVPLCHELHALFRVMWSGKWAIVSPHAILSSIWRLIPSFKGYSQQDAQEFLCELLDKLNSEMHFAVSSTVVSPNPRSMLTPSEIISSSFQGQLVSQVTCLECLINSNTYEPFWDLSLEFPERYQCGRGNELSTDSCHVTEMLAKFTEVEKLEGRVYECDYCNSRRRRVSSKPIIKTEASKQLLITTLPQVLRLHLKRFRWSGRMHREKINVHVDFSQRLDMKPFCSPSLGCEPLDYEYDLAAVVIHHGRGFGSGHYTAYCWNAQGGFWVHCNDSRLDLCSIEDVTSCQAYILFYTQKKLRPNICSPLIEDRDVEMTISGNTET